MGDWLGPKHRSATVHLFVARETARTATPRALQRGELPALLARSAGWSVACADAGGDLAARRGRRCEHH